MSKHRTKEQKLNPRRPFLLSWSPEPKKESSKADVKRQIKTSLEAENQTLQPAKNANRLAQEDPLRSVKSNILKSLIIVSFIISLEVVLYLAWHVR